MSSARPLCVLCERPTADGAVQAVHVDKEKLQTWLLNFCGNEFAEEIEDEDLICYFCIWHAEFLAKHDLDFEADSWWPQNLDYLDDAAKELRKSYFDGKVEQSWVQLEEIEQSESEETESESGTEQKKRKCFYCMKSYRYSSALVYHVKNAHKNAISSNTMSASFAAIFLLGVCLANAVNFTTVYEWHQFEFTWPNEQIGQNFNPIYINLRYMAVFGERLFLSLDSSLGNHPATLVWLPTSGTSTASPKLAPFPSWDLHKKNNCFTIQKARGLETDTDGRLWVLDDGSHICPGQLLIFDLVNNDRADRIHQFPDSVVSHSYNNRYLRDIVLDKTPDDYLAYIMDSRSEQIDVYSRKMDKSWSVKTPGRKWYSLALSPNREVRQLYLGRDHFKELYSVSVSELKNEGGSAAVEFIGRWTERPYRMLIDSANVLYAAFYEQSYTSKWNISEPFLEQRFYEVGELGVEYPFTFELDTNGNLWMTERNKTIINVKRHKLLEAAVSASTAHGTTSVTTSSRIPVSKTTMKNPTEEQTRQRFTTASTRQHSSAPPLTTLTTIYANEETTEVVKSLETAGIAEDDRKCQSSNKILIWLLVCCFSCLVLCGIVILWLALRMRRIMQTSLRQNPMDNNEEMYVFPGQQALRLI
ncbi:uncharacterized protein LOC135937375 [Cloeon dipterum]|uniref:uncharacterized protein LOC135937375 n=1 Tax=Cloeon dipterum TaxID=197152 RepID=UPI00321FEAE4